MRGKYISRTGKWIIGCWLASFSITVANSYLDNKQYYTTKDLDCLAKNIYYEARGEPKVGQLYVGYTTISRKMDKGFPNTICEVVYQPYQFSWTLTKNKQPFGQAWKQAKVMAHHAFNTYDPKQHNVRYFHSVKIRPAWAIKKRTKTKIGNHIFYYDT